MLRLRHHLPKFQRLQPPGCEDICSNYNEKMPTAPEIASEILDTFLVYGTSLPTHWQLFTQKSMPKDNEMHAEGLRAMGTVLRYLVLGHVILSRKALPPLTRVASEKLGRWMHCASLEKSQSP